MTRLSTLKLPLSSCRCRYFKSIALVTMIVLIAQWSPTTSAQEADDSSMRNAYFGDLHLHTGYSFDAFIVRTTATPDDTYRFSKGETIQHAAGYPIRIVAPLDFAAVTDHAEYLGVLRQMVNPASPLSKLPLGQAMMGGDVTAILGPYNDVLGSVADGAGIDNMLDTAVVRSTWEKVVNAANSHYEPGKFTTFVGFEWTSMPDSQNLHRNVIFRGSEASDMPFSAFDSEKPEDLWTWIDAQRERGIEAMAIPHNANVSNGLMYADRDSEGNPLTAAYAAQRMRNEPINEVVQIKGQSMTHPILSPNDEFAAFEIYPLLLNTITVGRQSGSFVREAFLNGIGYQAAHGFNPYQFGVIGSSDSHNAASSVEENNYFGKLGFFDGTPERRLHPAGQDSARAITQMSAAGLAGVWAEENTRESIFDALRRRETFATSGSRIRVRFFAGWNYPDDLPDTPDWVERAYAGGVPMGGELPPTESGEAPRFVVHALKDPNGANLDRIQMIKGWVDGSGNTHEAIYNVALSDARKPDANGGVPPVGNTVNLEDGTYSNSIGDTELVGIWMDPDFEPGRHAFYYVRVLEIPTPRWSTLDAIKLGETPPNDLPSIIQERAWSSPIWYQPK